MLSKNRFHLRCWPIALLALLCLAGPAPSSAQRVTLRDRPHEARALLVPAHPLDALLQDVRLRLLPGVAQADVRLVVGALVAPRIWDEADADADGAVGAAEAEGWGRRYLDQLDVLVDGTRLPLELRPQGVRFPTTRNDFLSGASATIELDAQADLATLGQGEHALSIVAKGYPDISVYALKARGLNGLVVREATRMSGSEAHFPLVVSKAAAPAPTAQDEPVPPSTFEPEQTSPLLTRLRSQTLDAGFLAWTLLAALAFGALHALQPGHGKTLVAAYLVGTRGTVGHAIALGGIVTFTHTASVLLLGGLLLAFSATIKLERIVPGLTIASGLLVAGLGLRLLGQRLREARPTAPGTHEHHHSHAHDHGHQHDHDHHDQGHAHDHAHGHHHIPERITPRSLVALGISGGIVPCPEALVILIVAIAVGRLGLGLLMIVCFSLGLAGVLIALGVALVTLGGRLRGRLPGMQRAARWLPAASAALVVALGTALAWQGLAGI